MATAGAYQRVDRLGAGQLAGLLPDPAGMRPAYRHLAQAIGELILDGRIALHVRLPAERELATALRVSRATVTAVYDLLRESGYARSRQGSGTWTALPEGRAPKGVTRYMGAADTAIDLAKAAPGIHGGVLRDALDTAAPLLDEHTGTAGYHPYGLPELRAAVAERFTRRGLATVPEQILVTAGAQHALSLVLALLGRPGDRIMVESPSYPTALDAMRRARLSTVPVPVTEAGWDVAIAVSTLRQAVPRLAYLIPDFHNPTGRVMPDQERGRILRAARASGTWLVVDETMAEIALDVPSPRPFATHAAPGAAGQVITIGSMSKTHWGGLRVGWLRAPSRLVTELAAQRVATDMGGAVLDQLVSLALLAGDLLPARLELLRAQRAALVGALAEHLPHWTFRLPPGGLSLWVDLGEPLATPLAERALDYGVRIEGGSCFATDPGVFEQRLRIPFTLPPATLREAAARLAAALASPDLTSASTASRPRWVA